jgi:hypothetical protein
MVLHGEAGSRVFSTNTALKKPPVGRRFAARVVTTLSSQIGSPKHDRYSVGITVLHPRRNDPYMTATFEVSRPPYNSAIAGMLYPPGEIALFELERAQNFEGRA